VLTEIGADVVALQEAHPPAALPPRWRNCQGVEYEVVYGPTITKGKRPFGNVVLSRHPVSRVRRIDLSLPGLEPRGALDVVIEVAPCRVRVVSTHLALRARARAIQVSRLLEQCDDCDEDLLVLLGDINEWRGRGPALRQLEDRLGAAPAVPSFPSRWPIFALDRVWTRPGDALLAIDAHFTAKSARASDHLPVVASVAIPDGADRREREASPQALSPLARRRRSRS
jgi:endonuclease/exonuclease/phosphatase family metal-dependent hydrolase